MAQASAHAPAKLPAQASARPDPKVEAKGKANPKAEKPKKGAKGSSQAFVPFAVETMIIFSRLVVLLVGAVVAGLSVWNGVDALTLLVRVVVAVFFVGIILWFASWWFASNALDYAITLRKKEEEEEQKKREEAEKGESTLEVSA